MKKITAYILGILTGIILTIVVLVIIGLSMQKKQEADKGIGIEGAELFDEPGNVIDERAFTVIQSFENGTALAAGEDNILTVVLLWHNGEHGYYDHQMVQPSEGEQFRQIGLYRYESSHGAKTVPIVAVEGIAPAAQ